MSDEGGEERDIDRRGRREQFKLWVYERERGVKPYLTALSVVRPTHNGWGEEVRFGWQAEYLTAQRTGPVSSPIRKSRWRAASELGGRIAGPKGRAKGRTFKQSVSLQTTGWSRLVLRSVVVNQPGLVARLRR